MAPGGGGAGARSRRRFLPGLDGLRAIAVVLVIFHHLCSQGALSGWPVVAGILKHGSFGVQVFFVLSGFLITTLLLGEQDATGSVKLGRFYWRRSVRILPPALVYLAAIGALTIGGAVSAAPADFAYAALFARNVQGAGGAPELQHYWSLAVEEQFYLTWPLVLVLVRGRLQLALAAAAFVVLSVIRIWGGVHFGVTAAGAQALLLGCLLALTRQGGATAWLSRGFFQHPLVPAAAVAVTAVVVFSPLFSAHTEQAMIFALMGVAAVINYVIVDHRGPMTRLLNLPPVVWVGRLSYSLYLWQQLFCWSALSGLYAHSHWPLLIAGSLACAAASYYLVERPALAMRDRGRTAPQEAGGLPRRIGRARLTAKEARQ